MHGKPPDSPLNGAKTLSFQRPVARFLRRCAIWDGEFRVSVGFGSGFQSGFPDALKPIVCVFLIMISLSIHP